MSTSPSDTFQHARLALQNGDLAGAFQQANKAEAKLENKDSDWAWRFRVLKGEVLVRQGKSGEALDLLKADPPPSLASDPAAVRREDTLGLANFFLQHPDEAHAHLSNAEAIAHKNCPDLLVEVYQAQGTIAVLNDNFNIAEKLFSESLRLARRQEQLPFEANSLASLGLTFMRQGRYDEAIDWFTRSLAISDRLKNHVQIAKTSGNLGWSYFQMGDFERSLSLFTQAEELSVKQGLLRDQLVWLTNIGLVNLQQRYYSQAGNYFRRALEIARGLHDGSQTALCLENLALVAIATKDFGDADTYNKEAFQLERNTHRNSEWYPILIEGVIRRAQGKTEAAARDFEALIRGSKEISLRWQAQTELAETYVKGDQPELADVQFRKALDTIDDARSSLSKEEYRLSFLNIATEFYNEYIDFLIARRHVDKALAVAEHSRARTLAEGLGIKPASLESKNLDARELARRQHAVILAYWLKPERSYLWAITPEKISLFTLPADTEINAAVQEYRKALTGPRDPLETENAAGQQLYKMLVAPAERFIPANSRVVIIADGLLYGLNFETLLAPSPTLHYWIDDVTVSNANSLAMLRSAGQHQTDTKANLLLIGDPVPASNEFPSLPAAKDEIHDVASHFAADHETVIDGAKATPAAYLDGNPSQFSYVHFVAHGTASRLSPLDSAVILSPQNDSYKLYARDIVQKPLRADLVTISACYGTGSRAYSGEGLVGLSWAFLRAGARNVIAALWEANDVSTPKLMDAMYAQIDKGEDPATALREAKLSLLHSDTVYRRPFYWAPFQVYVGPGQTRQFGREQLTASRIDAARSR